MPNRKRPSLKLKHQKIFDDYLQEFETVPSYKKVLSTMIKFEKMYRPIIKPWGHADPFGALWGENERRKLKRAQVYMNRKDIISTIDKKQGKRLVVTSRGHKIFYKDYPLAKLRREPWDGVWTVIMYDFPENERNQRNWIRRRLMDLGFGSPQISILVSPLPIEEPTQQLLEGEGASGNVWTLRAERILGMENREVAQKAWPVIDELNLLYQELIEAHPQIKNSQELKEQWHSYFLAINSADPYLPRELLPESWQGGKCEEMFRKTNLLGLLRSLFKNSLLADQSPLSTSLA